MSEQQEHWSEYAAHNPGPAGEYWIVGKGMRIVATCQKPADCLQIASDHNRIQELENELQAATLGTAYQIGSVVMKYTQQLALIKKLLVGSGSSVAPKIIQDILDAVDAQEVE